jgi:hypothetical protein
VPEVFASDVPEKCAISIFCEGVWAGWSGVDGLNPVRFLAYVLGIPRKIGQAMVSR